MERIVRMYETAHRAEGQHPSLEEDMDSFGDVVFAPHYTQEQAAELACEM